MLLSFKTTTNELYQEEFALSATIKDVKIKMAEKYNYAANKMKLIWHAKMLQDNVTVKNIGFKPGTSIVLHGTKVSAPAANAKPAAKKQEPVEIKEAENAPPAEQTQVREVAAPSSEPLPQFSRNRGRPDPPGFRSKVQQLTALGFAEGDCEDALRASLGNVDRAADFLLSGYIPEVPPMISTADVPMADEDDDDLDSVIFEDDDYDSEEEEGDEGAASLRRFTRWRDQLIRDPNSLRAFLNQMIEENPAVAGLIRDDPRAFLGSIGLNPDDFDLTGLGKVSQYELLMGQFNETEKDAIHQLEKLGLDTMMIIQVFVACDKNLELARECLQSMM